MITICPFPKNKIKAVIFDFDGTLADTESNWFVADKKLLSDYGVFFTKDMKEKYIGGSSYDMMKDVKKRYNINDPIQTLLDKKNNYYLDYASDNTVFYSQMKELVKILSEKKYILAVASGSSRIILDKIFYKHDMSKYFDAIVSVEEVTKGKPAPDVFLEVAKRLEILPENILVFEDSPQGIDAAKAALMQCVAIPYLLSTILNKSFYKADVLFENGMKEFTVEKIIKWIENI